MGKTFHLKQLLGQHLGFFVGAAALALGQAQAASVLLGIDDAADQLVQINVDTGAITVVGDLNAPAGVVSTNYSGLAVGPDGSIFTTAGAELVRIDPATGPEIGRQATGPGATVFPIFTGLDFDGNGTLVASQSFSSSSSFGTFDDVTGEYVVSQQTGAPIVGGTFFSGVAFDPNDTLFGFGPFTDIPPGPRRATYFSPLTKAPGSAPLSAVSSLSLVLQPALILTTTARCSQPPAALMIS